MDRILKRPASSEPSSPVSSRCKKPMLNAKQGDVSPSFRGQNLGANFYESCFAAPAMLWLNSPSVTPSRVALFV